MFFASHTCRTRAPASRIRISRVTRSSSDMGSSDMTWLDRSGNYHSNKLKVTERFNLIDENHLQYEATLEDPEVYSRPWTIRMPLYRRLEPNAEILEFKCVPFVEELLYKDLELPQ